MWMSQRVGSSWVSRLLNSHPEIAMKGEKYNNCQDDDCLEEMCRLFTAPASPETRVRGFKQKFLYCGGGPQLERKMCLPPDAGLNALERCLLPDDPSIGIYEKGFLWQWDANGTRDNVSMTIRRHQHILSYQIFTHVGAKVVCMLRRNAFDIALSIETHSLLVQRCGVSNLVNDEAVGCWDEVRREGVRVNVTHFTESVLDQSRFTRFQVEVCEAQARHSPVYFLWYEDLLNDFSKATHDLQVFLGVTPMELSSSMQKTNEDVHRWILNFDELIAAAEGSITMLQSSSEECNGVLGARGMLRNASGILGSADMTSDEAGVGGDTDQRANSDPAPLLLVIAAAAAGCAVGALAARASWRYDTKEVVARPAPTVRGGARAKRGKRLPRRAAPRTGASEYASTEQAALWSCAPGADPEDMQAAAEERRDASV
uniref:Sulfotransferase domain-containing protein n=2 Tax=Emiliania huxleyi TaxID=2903 RepID=A0A7S3W528_EMIHU